MTISLTIRKKIMAIALGLIVLMVITAILSFAWVLGHSAVSTALVGARTAAEVDENDAGTELELSSAERATIDAILAGAVGRVGEFTPLRPAMEPWGEEVPPTAPARPRR